MVLLLIFSAIHLAGWLNYVLVGISGVTLAGVVYRTKGFIKGNELRGQIEQKNEVIHTNEQAIDSFRARVQALEDDFTRVSNQSRIAQDEVKQLHQELATLEHYAAPEAVERFEKTLAARDVLFQEILHQLERLHDKINHLNDRANGT